MWGWFSFCQTFRKNWADRGSDLYHYKNCRQITMLIFVWKCRKQRLTIIRHLISLCSADQLMLYSDFIFLFSRKSIWCKNFRMNIHIRFARLNSLRRDKTNEKRRRFEFTKSKKKQSVKRMCKNNKDKKCVCLMYVIHL